MEIDRRTLFKAAGLGAGALGIAGAGGAAAQSPGPLSSAVQSHVVGENGLTGPLQLARVWPGAVQGLLDSFDDTHNVFDDGSVEVLLWPGDLARLQGTGLRHEITVTDVVSRDRLLEASAGGRTAALPLQPGEGTAYRRLADYERDLRKLAADHPDLARIVELPNKSLEGRTVIGIEIAERVADVDGRPTFYMDGVHHAREWPASEFTIMWAYDLLESYRAGDTRVVPLMQRLRFFIVPIMNVDGFHYSRESLVDNANTASGNGAFAYWRKNRRTLTGVNKATPVSDASNPDAYGIDCNRNYGYAWGGDGSSASMTDQTYRGPAPFSEPETRNVQWALSTRHATAMITNHTSGNLILWAWGDTRDDAPDNDLLVQLGTAMSKFNGYKPQKSIDLYVTTGTCSDYAYGAYGSLGYTFEHAGSSFHPNYLTTIPKQYSQNRPAFLLLAEAAVNDELHGVITGRVVNAAGDGVKAPVKIRKAFDTLLWKNGNGGNPTGMPSVPEKIDTTFASADDGTFTLHVNPSTRPYLSFRGETESYELVVGETVRQVVVDRGGRTDAGVFTIG